MLFDLPLEELRTYSPNVPEPHDFDDFWAQTLQQARSHALEVSAVLIETPYTTIDTYDLSFAGFDGHRVRAWLRVPKNSDRPAGVIVQYHGYQGGRGHLLDAISWNQAGYAHLSVDNRGQGATWQEGHTADPAGGTGPEHAGFMTRGISSPETYYYRRLFTDAVRAVEAVRTLPFANPAKTLVTGISQGGAIALAVAALVPDLAGALIDVPFLCHIDRALTITDRDPYSEVVRYMRVKRDMEESALRTLSYVDGANMARRATAPALFSVALMDPICPPSTVFAAYNRYAGSEKEIVVYPWNEHEGGQMDQEGRKLRWAAERVL